MSRDDITALVIFAVVLISVVIIAVIGQVIQ